MVSGRVCLSILLPSQRDLEFGEKMDHVRFAWPKLIQDDEHVIWVALVRGDIFIHAGIELATSALPTFYWSATPEEF